ncbi:MAG: outer membrane protein assembly factor BamD [Planctomycetes bacterium]|nr:outer membrane protein assembly factor BamD [Planctomycetota bacterium]
MHQSQDSNSRASLLPSLSLFCGKASRPTRRAHRIAVLLLLQMTLAPGPVRAEPPAKPEEIFESLLQKVQKAQVGGASEEEAKQLLSLSRDLGRILPASSAIRNYLKANSSPSPSLLLKAAEHARLAGDFRTAVTRYKAYLSKAAPGEEASLAAAALYTVQVDFLGDADDAYQFMSLHGEKFRQTVLARKFDEWYLSTARSRKQLGLMARRLLLILQEKMPLEMEKLYFWWHLDGLLEDIRWTQQDLATKAEALPYLREMLPLLRDPGKSLAATFYVKHLEFMASAPGKKQEDLDKDFESVLAAARAFFDNAPHLGTLDNIMYVFYANDWNVFNRQLGQKQAFFLAALEKLPLPDRVWFFNNRRHCLQEWGWWQLSGKQPEYVPHFGDLYANWPDNYPDNWENLRKHAAALENHNHRYALIVKSLAAGNDLNGCVDVLVQRHAWQLNFGDPYELLTRPLWSIYRRLPRPDGQPLPGDSLARAVLHLGNTTAVQSPIALFDLAAVKDFILQAWRYGGDHPNDKSRVAAACRTLDWVPYTAEERQNLFGPVLEEFKTWSKKLQDSAAAKADFEAKSAAATKAEEKRVEALKSQSDSNALAEAGKLASEAARAASEAKTRFEQLGNVTDAELAQIKPLEEVLNPMLDPKHFDLAKSPNPLCQNLAAAVIALREKNLENYLKCARDAYHLVKNYPAQKTPFGYASLRFILANRFDLFDTFDFQVEILADQLNLGRPEESLAGTVFDSLCSGRPNWHSYAPATDEPKMKKLNDLFAAALRNLLAKGQFSPSLFYWLRYTRNGNGWDHRHDWNVDVMERMIQEKTLFTHNYKPVWGERSMTRNIMQLVTNEFHGLHGSGRFSIYTYFADMFIEEAGRTGDLDYTYWDWGYQGYGEQIKVIDYASKLLQTKDTVDTGKPFGVNFWNWSDRCYIAGGQRQPLLDKLEALYGKTRFDGDAMGGGYFKANDLGLGNPENRKEFFRRLNLFLERARTQPVRHAIPSLYHLSQIGDPKSFTTEELQILARAFEDATDTWGGRRDWHVNSRLCYEPVILLFQDALLAKGQDQTFCRLVPTIWKMVRELVSQNNDPRYYRKMAEVSGRLIDERKYDLAAVYSSKGLDMIGGGLPEEVRTALTAARTKSLSSIGWVIPVPRTDPLYPLYEAQIAYLSGNVQKAWNLYLDHAGGVLRAFRDLDSEFILWLIDKNTEVMRFEAAEALSRAMMQWIDGNPGAFDSETLARLLVSYAGIALARKEYPRARAQFGRVIAAREFEATRAKIDAELRIAEVDRLTKNYDRAVQSLEKLARHRDKNVQKESFYQLALVKFDQEEFVEAGELLERVFVIDPEHSDARILQGKIFLKRKKLVEATEIDLGIATRQKILVPGTALKIKLEDRNLSIVGRSTNIEVRAWTESGDEEFFNLLPFGDSKTKFEGHIQTQLAPLAKGDHILQLLGDDKIHYDFSEKFKEAQHVAASEAVTLSVATDAEFQASSGKILTRKELEDLAFERLARAHAKDADAKSPALSTLRSSHEVRPGNSIYARVTDPDRSVSADRDAVAISVATSSGDAIAGIELRETEPYSGIFQGVIPTASAQATAYASDSEEGRLPNFVISAADYPAWVGEPNNQRPKTFSVDLNDNVLLGPMKILADVPGRKLKEFYVLTSLNGRDFTTVASWPAEWKPWDGSLQCELVKAPGEPQKNWDDYLRMGRFRLLAPLLTLPAKALSADFDANVWGQREALRIEEHGWYLAHFRGAFFLPEKRVRTFQLDPKGRLENIRYSFTLDGQPGGDSTDPLRISRPLKKGVHVLEAFLHAYRYSNNPSFQVLMDVEQPPYMAACPADLFDVEKYPEIRKAFSQAAAAITASQDASAFDLVFPPGTRARIVRLLLADFETDAPALRRLQLADASGKPLLPTSQDFAELMKNATLELVPGDRISMSYTDPKYITKGKDIHEAFMDVTYNNGTLSACLVEYALAGGSTHQASYVPLRRFKTGEAVTIFVRDPDGDGSEKLDTLDFTVRTSDTQPITLKALETEPHSGVFVGKIFPIEGKPERPSEITVKPGDEINIGYFDRENTDYGIPWERQSAIEQAFYKTPELRVYEVASQEASHEQAGQKSGGVGTAGGQKAGPTDAEAGKAAGQDAGLPAGEAVAASEAPPARSLVVTRPARPDPSHLGSVFLDGPILVEVLWPTIALSATSSTTLYAQTSSGRKLQEETSAEAFDIRVPGTIRLTASPGDAAVGKTPLGYQDIIFRGDPEASDALTDGRFVFTIPVQLGEVPEKSLAVEEDAPALPDPAAQKDSVLRVKGDDEIHVGFRYTDDKGASAWLVQSLRLRSEPFFAVLDRKFEKEVSEIYVGEHLYFQVTDKARDVSRERDQVSIDLETTSGKTLSLVLKETFEHTGVFQGLIPCLYAEVGFEARPAEFLPCLYGDTITATYRPDENAKPLARRIVVQKGSDGSVLSFTKRFNDAAIGIQTQFTVAEAYFELAKKHRALNEEALARREISQGKKLLEEAIRDFPDTEARAQADYLLANLSLEFAADSKNEEAQRRYFMEAVTRFSDLVASYPDSPYAAKSQFKKALTLEKMGQMDLACEEYVKLSYRYPENELVAETIARLGQYFWTKGKGLKQDAEARENPLERDKILLQARQMYETAAEVFGRLAARFPNHQLAGKTTVLSAQAYMMTEDFARAAKVFKKAIKQFEDEKDVVAEAMYWCGDCFMKQKNFTEAYRLFKKLTWDYPESKWAKFARGQLSSQTLLSVEESALAHESE